MASQPTRQIVNIDELRDSVIVLKNRTLRMILEVSAVNFELRSEDEQAAVIQSFQQFINSIDFPLQMVVSSRRFDVDAYLKSIEQMTESATSDLMKIQATEYVRFVKELSTLANIMAKKFYIVIPFYVTESVSGQGIMDRVTGLFKSKKPQPIPDDKLDTYKTQLNQRAELVFDGLVGMGLKTKILEGKELADVLYGAYNPGSKSNLPPL
jgi:hypothetical protein